MTMKILSSEDGSDQEVSEGHSKLIEVVRELDKGQRVKKPERSEPSLTISEFHLVKSGVTDDDVIQVSDLVKTLGQKGHHTVIGKQIDAAKKKSKILSKPLETPVAERIKRVLGFENTKKDLQKWNAVVAKNRTAESISFPLNQPPMRLEPTNEYLKTFRLQSDLEKKLSAVEPVKENLNEEEDELELTLEEILQRRAEAAKFRAQQSYKVAKAHRQNKIKSKKFHRIQRKEKTKQQLKEFEELLKTDPETAKEKLNPLQKVRAEERMTLRHKSTGHWARNKLIRAKYDKEIRQELAEQLSISRDLTQKIQTTEDSDEGDEEDKHAPVLDAFKENPWINKTKTESEMGEFINQYRKYWDNQNLKRKNYKQHDSIEVIEKENMVSKNYGKASVVKIPEGHSGEKVAKDSISYNHGVGGVNVNTSYLKKKNCYTKAKGQESPMKDKVSKLVKSAKGVNNKKRKLDATSSWTVSNLDNSEHSSENKSNKIDIDDVFDSMHDTIKYKVERKIKNIRRENKLNVRGTRNEADNNEGEVEDNYFDKLQWKQSKLKSIIDQPLNEVIDKRDASLKSVAIQKTLNSSNQEIKIQLHESPQEVRIDPNAFKSVKTKQLKTQIPDVNKAECEALDDDDEEPDGYELMNEAFSHEDVVEDFRKEKEEVVKNSLPEDVDLKLPGWGTWGGKNIKHSSRKKRRFVLKFPEDAPRRGENKGNLIIIEESNLAIKKHKVTELPFPFSSINDYEASMRAPIGRNFVPEKTHRRLIKPEVMTKMGKVIEPMDEDSLVSTKNFKIKRDPGSKEEFFKKRKVKL
ncbi:U3 small nucleolar RNA-associated protein 14 homolog A [Belonocnema kinseyi]|uniref:U3 small nucleolar RNA-associated protein 14 homolog A n=1 Tax=Belonocnema kinseyi TaxID=2817044 RepID=UPI00143DF3F0|nr:U3 small nucleolar RNA-associated protein 14 homolog A [Belonocnema kinseyi]XP_033229809.1 U3 small nucleolar RNA-associated protein 14 homolog A [Belonocnema kinseyi]XP_033229810.1 U3 small nucleolar RNA-associated protein 14 homolog A [Belonocnema kinseyi]